MVRALPAVVVVCLCVGCGGEAVREDRAIDWDRGGETVAFQHDAEGVFVAGKDGQGLTRIFEPDDSVLATSRPLYSPIDGRLIFTTAYDPNGEKRPDKDFFPSPAEGKTHFQRPVKYTCWLREDAHDENPPAPRELFHASCEHIGYVAAGLAVRWHPDGKRVLFIESQPAGDRRHGVYEFDLQTRKTRLVFPHRADALIFDFTPRSSQLVCVTGSPAPREGEPTPGPQAANIWIGNPDDVKSWWKVLGAERLAEAELPSLIERLRASRPAWTDDDRQFASVTTESAPGGAAPERSLLQVTDVATRKTQTIHQTDGLFSDLHWSHDGRMLGFIEQGVDGAGELRIYDRDGKISEPVGSRPVRKFAGFDKTGARLAYVVANETGLPEPAQEWATILAPDRLARDSVIVAETGAPAAGRQVFGGMRVTFPVWSPQDDRLSLWLTFSPRYRSLFSVLFRWGLWPGDPAATLDLATGDISWMAVSPAEELQVGHYYLLQKDYARAWEWYEKANGKLPARKPSRDLAEFVSTIGAPERSQLFEFHCLRQLGRDGDAQEKLADFERTFFPGSPVPGQAAGQTIDDILRQFGPEAELLKQLLHDLYVAEVFLSLDAPDAGIAILQQQVARGENEPQRLSANLALAQIFLAAGRREEYLAICAEELAPRVLTAWNVDGAAAAQAGAAGGANPNGTFVLSIAVGLTLMPLAYPEFLAGIPDTSLRAALAAWEAKRPQLAGPTPMMIVDLFLRAAHLALGENEQAGECEARIAASPGRTPTPENTTIDEELRELREKVRQFSTPGGIWNFGAVNNAAPRANIR